MALTRKFLSALGIEQDKVDEIINAHSETVEALKEERDGLKDKADKAAELQKELDAANAKVKELNKEDTYKVKYDAIKEEFDEYKKGVETEKAKATKTAAFKELLKEIGISEKRIEAVAKVSDINSLKLDKEGKIEGADDLKKSLKEEWAEFIVTETQQGANTATPPANNGGKKTKEEIYAIKDRDERQKAMLENKDLFF